MEQQCRWSIVAMVVVAVILQSAAGRVDADVLQPQLAPPSPEFVRYHSSLQSRSGAVDTGLVPSPVDRSHLDGKHVTWQGAATPLPASYDLRTEGRVTGVRDQGTSSSCWTFGTYGSLESTMLPAETLDFSENNLKNTSGFDYGPNWGGNGDMATAYLTRWSGPIAEEDDPYDPDSTASLPDLSPIRHVQNVMILPKRSGPLDTADIKRAIIDYGAVVGSMCWTGDGSPDTPYYKLDTSAYYYAGSAESNHVVTVVGWDDAFRASSFSTTPPGNGAWIVKNSWGTAWGQSGYYFMSYYDAVLFKKTPAYCFQAAEPTTNYERVYQYDPLGHTYSFGYGTTTAWEANVFVAGAAENVRAIGFYTLDVNCSYEARVYGSWNGSTFSDLLSSTTGTIPSPGYHTVVLPSPGALVASGQTFGVVVKLVMSTDYPYPIALEKPILEYSMGATASKLHEF
jgi:C1A family cysteine protease